MSDFWKYSQIMPKACTILIIRHYFHRYICILLISKASRGGRYAKQGRFCLKNYQCPLALPSDMREHCGRTHVGQRRVFLLFGQSYLLREHIVFSMAYWVPKVWYLNKTLLLTFFYLQLTAGAIRSSELQSRVVGTARSHALHFISSSFFCVFLNRDWLSPYACFGMFAQTLPYGNAIN